MSDVPVAADVPRDVPHSQVFRNPWPCLSLSGLFRGRNFQIDRDDVTVTPGHTLLSGLLESVIRDASAREWREQRSDSLQQGIDSNYMQTRKDAVSD